MEQQIFIKKDQRILDEINNPERKAVTGIFTETPSDLFGFELIECDLKIIEPDGSEYFYHYKAKSYNPGDVDITEIDACELIEPETSPFGDIMIEIQFYHLKRMYPEFKEAELNLAIYEDIEGPKPFTFKDKSVYFMIGEYFAKEKMKREQKR